MALTSLPIWRDEKLLFLRERDSGAYGTPAYFAAVVLFDLLPMRIIPPTFFALFSYWMIGLHQSSAVCLLRFIGALGSVVTAVLCANKLSCSCSNIVQAVSSPLATDCSLKGCYLQAQQGMSPARDIWAISRLCGMSCRDHSATRHPLLD